MPQVSVILPVFNAQSTVRRAVCSVLQQSFTDLQVIAVDDGSIDGTLETLGEIDDPRLTVIAAEHQGVCAASNLALEHATGPLVARMDADDICHPEKIARQVQWLTETGCDVVGCQVRIVDTQQQPVASLERYQRWINEETLTSDQIFALRFVELPLVNPTILAKRSYFGSGYQNSDLPEDFDLFLRAAHGELTFAKVPRVLFDWTDSDTRLTRTDGRYSDEAFDECRRSHLLAGPLADVTSVDVWGAGQTGKRWLRWLQGQGISVRQLVEVSPRKIGREIHGVPVIDYQSLPPADGTLMLAAVGADRARQMIWPWLADRGYHIGHDALFVA
ncbi:MAG: glycosyltransferase [Planctomycetaceae bacterium]|nr:glycosyltransferase [Planctomycetaceae bacterium]